jgi:nondiscriminating aspartyl-tRNA synthetase
MSTSQRETTGAFAGPVEQKAAEGSDDQAAHLYGDFPIMQSTEMTERHFKNLCDLSEDHVNQTVWIRGRLANSRPVGKGLFIILRQGFHTAQAVMFQGSKISKQMVKYAASLSLESIIDICATVTIAENPITSTTVKTLELSIDEIHCVSRAEKLPFTVEDAGRNAELAAKEGLPIVGQDNLLNFRWIDLRTPANQAIFRIQSGVGQLFREFLYSKRFIEIHSPKLIGGASEGGANVFKLQYFNQPACLAQSPQLYKQMAAACSGFERVFEIGPVFRAENSNTHRHLCEFTGLDFEMAICEHYYEALDLMSHLFIYIFDGLNERFCHELQIISQQYPFEPLQYLRPTLRITFKEGIDILKAAGVEANYLEDLSTTQEKVLGALVKEKYGTDFYIMDKYPLAVRPFYTMPCPEDPTVSNSYDLFIRGEEIVSGAQRVHDVNLLIERANAWKIPLNTIQSYIDAFRHGALPHAGGGIGLERVAMLFLGLGNIRKTSLFPRDPSRIFP